MTSRPPPDQAARHRIATELDRNMIVSAGAGAGKTTELVSRYMALLARRAAEGAEPDVSSIVVVTFTELAAEELKGRIRRECRQRAAALRQAQDRPRLPGGHPERSRGAQATEAGNAGQRAFWLRAERSLLMAPISTIHAFCYRLLRQGALAAPLDPDLAVLDAARQTLLLDNVINEFLFGSWLEHPCTQRLLVHMDLPQVEECLRVAIHNGHEWEELPRAWDGVTPLADARERFVAQRMALVAERLEEGLSSFADSEAWAEAMAELRRAAPPFDAAQDGPRRPQGDPELAEGPLRAAVVGTPSNAAALPAGIRSRCLRWTSTSWSRPATWTSRRRGGAQKRSAWNGSSRTTPRCSLQGSPMWSRSRPPMTSMLR